MLRTVVLSLAVLLLNSPARASEPPQSPAAAQNDDEQAWVQKLQYANTLIIEGKQQQAIDEHINPVIAHYEAKYASEKRRIYCASSPTLTLLYLGEAAKDHMAAIAIGPAWSDAYFLKAYALIDLIRADEAKPFLERAVSLSPWNSHYLSELGNYYQSKKDWPKALGIFQSALAASEFAADNVKVAEKGRALRGVGFQLTELGRYDEAEQQYRAALALDPNDAGSKRELDYIAGKRGKGLPLNTT